MPDIDIYSIFQELSKLEKSKKLAQKNLLYFLKKFFLIFWGTELSYIFLKQVFLIFQEGTFRAQKIWKTHSGKMSYISGYATFKPQV